MTPTVQFFDRGRFRLPRCGSHTRNAGSSIRGSCCTPTTPHRRQSPESADEHGRDDQQHPGERTEGTAGEIAGSRRRRCTARTSAGSRGRGRQVEDQVEACESEGWIRSRARSARGAGGDNDVGGIDQQHPIGQAGEAFHGVAAGQVRTPGRPLRPSRRRWCRMTAPDVRVQRLFAAERGRSLVPVGFGGS